MESASFEMSLEQLRENCPLPAIVHWEQNHFVVLYAISKSRVGGKYKYHVANPAYGKHRMNEEEFCRGWLNGCKGIVIAMEPSDDFFSQNQYGILIASMPLRISISGLSSMNCYSWH